MFYFIKDQFVIRVHASMGDLEHGRGWRLGQSSSPYTDVEKMSMQGCMLLWHAYCRRSKWAATNQYSSSQCQHWWVEVMLILGMEGLLPCLALWPLPDFCHTPSLRRRRAGHWRLQYHRRADTFAAPVNILNT